MVEKDYAIVEHVVTDQGNGGAYCGKCGEWLTSNPFKIPDQCPRCKRKLVNSGSTWINTGGSDF